MEADKGPRGRARGTRREPEQAPRALLFGETERAAARLCEALGQGFALVDVTGRLLLVNRCCLDLAGLEDSRGGLDALLQSFFPRTAARRGALSLVLRSAREGLPARLDATRPKKLGEARVRLFAVPFGEGRRAAVVVRPLADALAEATPEAAFRELLEASPDLWLALDAEGRVIDVNRAALRLTGYSREEVLSRSFLRFVPRSSRDTLRALLSRFAAVGRVEELELELERRDGVPIPVTVSAVPRDAELGVGSGAHVVLRDETRRHLLQHQLRQTDRLAATGRLVAGVAHEINNPLQAMLMHLSVVDASLAEDFEHRESLERTLEAATRIRQIVADLLDLHRGGSERLGGVDVNAVVREALGLARGQLRKGQITVQDDLAEGLPEVAAAERHLYQVVLNLVLNALGAMPDGGELVVRTRTPAGRDTVSLDIVDTGPGIPEELLPHIFDPFQTTGQRGGTGLGLYVTYGIVKDYGGRIEVDSAPGRGTTFRLVLPAAGAGARDAGEH